MQDQALNAYLQRIEREHAAGNATEHTTRGGLTVKLKTIALTLWIVVLPVSAHLAAAEDKDLAAFVQESLKARACQEKLRQSDENTLKTAAEECLKTMKEPAGGSLGKDFFAFYRARFLLYAGRWQEAVALLASVVDSPTVAPEALYWLGEAADSGGFGDGEFYMTTFCGRLLAEMLPADSGHAERSYRPSLHGKRKELLAIAQKLMGMRMYPEAAVAAVEAAYYPSYPYDATSIRYQDTCWSSSETAPCWMLVAMAEWYRGNQKTMFDYVAKVIVFGDEVEKGRALGFVKRAGRQPDPVRPSPDVNTLREIASLYAKMNLHPRALFLLRQAIGPRTGEEYFSPELTSTADDRGKLLNLYNAMTVDLRYLFILGDSYREIFGRRRTIEAPHAVDRVEADDLEYVPVPASCRPSSLRKAAQVIDLRLADTLPPFESVSQVNRDSRLFAFGEQAMKLRRLGLLIADAFSIGKVSDLAQARALGQRFLDEFNALRLPEDGLGGDVFRYFHARLLCLAGKQDDARDLFAKLVGTSLTPQALLCLDKIAPDETWHEIMAKVLPIGCDAQRNSTYEGSAIPNLFIDVKEDPDHWANHPCIARMFAMMGMYDEMISAIEEALCFFKLRIDPFPYRDGDHWRLKLLDDFSSQTSAWMLIADAQRLKGDVTGAANSLALLIVYGYHHGALDMIEKMEQEAVPFYQPDPDPNLLKDITRMYVERNLHPRAWQLLDRYRDVIGKDEVERLTKDYEAAWLNLLKDHCQGDKCIVLGHDVTRVEDRLKITIPPAFSKEAIEEAAKKVKELLEKK